MRRPRILNFAFTFGGATFILVSVLVGLAAVSAEANMLYVMFGLCLGAMIVSGMLSTRAIEGLSIARLCPECVCAGAPFTITYLLTNTKRRTRCYSVHVREACRGDAPLGPCEAFVPRVDPGRTVAVRAPVRCDRRGRYELERILVTTRFPFGMFTKLARADLPSTLVVLPRLGRLRNPVVPEGTTPQPSDRHTRTLTGWMKEEFYGIREYRRGDSPKWIHWHRSARTGQLMVRDMRDDPRSQVIIVVNPRVRPDDLERAAGPASTPDGLEPFERALSCAATCCVAALEAGYLVALMILDRPPIVLPPVSGIEHRVDLLKNLATVQPRTDVDPVEVARLIRWRPDWNGHALIIGADPESTPAELTRVFARRCRSVRSYAVGTSAFDALYEHGAPTRSELESAGPSNATPASGERADRTRAGVTSTAVGGDA